MSVPCAAGTNPAATAAPEPPELPPGERARSHGLWVGPYAHGSVVPISAISGTLVRPSVTSPAARKARAIALSAGDRQPRATRGARLSSYAPSAASAP